MHSILPITMCDLELNVISHSKFIIFSPFYTFSQAFENVVEDLVSLFLQFWQGDRHYCMRVDI